MSLRRFCVFLSLPGVRQQIAETVAGGRKAGRGARGRAGGRHFASSAKGTTEMLSLCHAQLAAWHLESEGEERSLHFHVSSALYLIPPRVEPQEKAFVLESSSVYCTFCLPFLFLLCPSNPPPPPSPLAHSQRLIRSPRFADSIQILRYFSSRLLPQNKCRSEKLSFFFLFGSFYFF